MENNGQEKLDVQHQGLQGENTTISDDTHANDNGRETHEQERGSQKPSAEVSKKPTVSSRKIAANQRNALKSTGPRTTAGKKIVARNAIKHGFFSKWLLIQHRDGQESQGEYDELHAAIRGHYEPVGFLEGLWAEKIAVWYWRLRRLVRSETGHITRALAEHDHDREQLKAASEQPGLAPAANREIDSMTDYLFLPANEDLDKLLRFEGMITKQLNHAVGEIERLQARRKGETILGNFAKRSQQAP